MEGYQLALLAAVVCELILLAFIFCIARFYELKFRERTYPIFFLVPSLVFLALAAFAFYAIELDVLITNVCAIVVLATAGLLLYRKMMGVSR